MGSSQRRKVRKVKLLIFRLFLLRFCDVSPVKLSFVRSDRVGKLGKLGSLGRLGKSGEVR